MHLILTGATGVVGSAVLAHILSSPTTTITRLSILTRKPIPLLTTTPPPTPANPSLKINVITHPDFAIYPPSLLSELKDATGVVWALGISQNAVGKEEYVKITKDYTLAAAKALGGNVPEGQKLNFVYVSGEGATWSPGRFTPIFGRVKGETELALTSLAQTLEYASLRVYNARPGAVDPSSDPLVQGVAKDKVPTATQVSGKVLFPLIRNFYSNMHSPTKDLGRALTDLALSDGEPLSGKGVEADGRTLSNQGLRRLAGLSH